MINDIIVGLRFKVLQKLYALLIQIKLLWIMVCFASYIEYETFIKERLGVYLINKMVDLALNFVSLFAHVHHLLNLPQEKFIEILILLLQLFWDAIALADLQRLLFLDNFISDDTNLLFNLRGVYQVLEVQKPK